MLKRTAGALGLCLSLALAYIALPFWTAFSIREAVKSGDAAYLQHKIEWASVRATLRQSIAQHALDLPPITPTASAADAPLPSRGIWQRFKDYAGQRAIDSFVDRYITAEGLPQLHQYRTMYRQTIRGDDGDTAALPRLERMRLAWNRIVRAEFHSLTEFEIEQRDRFDAGRTYVGLLKLRGFEWKLTELRVKKPGAIAPVAVMR